jgi:hypothetical protein
MADVQFACERARRFLLSVSASMRPRSAGRSSRGAIFVIAGPYPAGGPLKGTKAVVRPAMSAEASGGASDQRAGGVTIGEN